MGKLEWSRKTFEDDPNGVFENPRIGTAAFAGNLFFDLFVRHRTTFLGIVSHQKCGSNGFNTVRNVVAARLCFYTCLSFCHRAVAGRHHSLDRQTPWRADTPPPADSPQDGHCRGRVLSRRHPPVR